MLCSAPARPAHRGGSPTPGRRPAGAQMLLRAPGPRSCWDALSGGLQVLREPGPGSERGRTSPPSRERFPSSGRRPVSGYVEALAAPERAVLALLFEEIAARGLEAGRATFRQIEGKLWQIQIGRASCRERV